MDDTERDTGTRQAAAMTVDEFRRTMEKLPVAAVLIDEDDRFGWLNPSFAVLQGLPAEQLLGSRMSDTVAKQSGILRSYAGAVRRTGEVARLPAVRHTPGDGVARWFTGFLLPLSAARGELTVGGLFIDTTMAADLMGSLTGILGQLPIILAATDRDLQFTWAAGAITPILGLTDDAGAGRTLFELVGTDDPCDPQIAPVLAALDGQETTYRQHRGQRWLDCLAVPMRDPDGAIVGSLTAIQDVTELELARQQVDIVHKQLMALIEHSPALVVLRDAEGTVVFSNEVFAKAIGAEREAVTGCRAADFLPPEAAIRLASFDALVRASDGPVRWQDSLARADGSEVPLLGWGFPLDFPDESTGSGLILLDLSELGAARRMVQETRQRFRAIVDHAGLAIISVDGDGGVEDINPSGIKLLARSPEQVRGRPWHGFFEPDPTAFEQVRQVIADRRRRIDHDLIVAGPDGTRTPVQVTATPIRSSDGRAAGAVLLVTPLVAEGNQVHRLGTELVTPAELEVLPLLAEGLAFTEIGERLNITRRGVDYRIKSLRAKLRDSASRRPLSVAGVVGRAYALGLLQPATWPPKAAPDPKSTS